jgi:hypothetical protein
VGVIPGDIHESVFLDRGVGIEGTVEQDPSSLDATLPSRVQYSFHATRPTCPIAAFLTVLAMRVQVLLYGRSLIFPRERLRALRSPQP